MAIFELWIVRAGAALFSIFGGLALALATVGVLWSQSLLGCAAHPVKSAFAWRLGAQRKTVQWMILREGTVMLASGVLLGVLLAAGTGKLISGMLYECRCVRSARVHDCTGGAGGGGVTGDLVPSSARDADQPDGRASHE